VTRRPEAEGPRARAEPGQDQEADDQDAPVRARPVRVALSNDYELALLGLAQMLAQHPELVQVVDVTTERQPPHHPDIILYDTFGRLPDDDVKLRKIVAENTAKVVVYSWEEYSEEAARRQGAAAYLHKGLNADQLAAAIVAVHDGEPPSKSDDTGEAVLTWPGQVFGLSQREAEMLTFITRGLSNEEIARRSYLSANTVKSYIRNAYRKIGVRTRPQAVAWGYRNGFQSTDDTGL
jgi:two-component system, NarL family, response regulator LiaR